MKKWMTQVLGLLGLVLILGLYLFSCKKDDSASTSASTNPEIVGCNSVKYKGTTFSNIGCSPGIASFDVSMSQNGVSASFHIICSNGCISAVTVK